MHGTKAGGGARPQDAPGDSQSPALARAALAGPDAPYDSWGDSNRVVRLDGPAVPSALLDCTPRDFVELPEVGRPFLGFYLLAELGRGTFGRVYLARQGDLADRYVALKVSADLAGESQTLARLQHTNIVPIYSAHRADWFQAVCMPFFGVTTLAHLLRRFRGAGGPGW